MSLSIEQAAEICNEAYRVYLQQQGDYSQPKWCELPEGLQNQQIANVNTILIKYRNMQIEPDDDLNESQKVKLRLEFGIVNALESYMMEEENV